MVEQAPFVDCCRVYVRQNIGHYALKPTCYGPLVEVWQNGKTFFTGATVDDEEVIIKLAEIEAVMLCSVASQEASLARRKAETKASEMKEFE